MGEFIYVSYYVAEGQSFPTGCPPQRGDHQKVNQSTALSTCFFHSVTTPVDSHQLTHNYLSKPLFPHYFLLRAWDYTNLCCSYHRIQKHHKERESKPLLIRKCLVELSRKRQFTRLILERNYIKILGLWRATPQWQCLLPYYREHGVNTLSNLWLKMFTKKGHANWFWPELDSGPTFPFLSS